MGAVRSAVHSGVRGEAGGLGWGVGETRVEAVVWWGWGGEGTGRAELPAQQSCGQVGREEAPRAPGEPGVEGAQPAATAAEEKEAERARSGPRAPGWLGAE